MRSRRRTRRPGATCLSILTDEPYFQGKLEYLRGIRQQVELPLLRKDFIVDPWQVVESRMAGADALLLIVAALPCEDLRCLLALTREYGMSALVEVHDADEMREAVEAGADFIGINNRDLHTFRTTLAVTLDMLAADAPQPPTPLSSAKAASSRAPMWKRWPAQAWTPCW